LQTSPLPLGYRALLFKLALPAKIVYSGGTTAHSRPLLLPMSA
jgi:hypothetical protein